MRVFDKSRGGSGRSLSERLQGLNTVLGRAMSCTWTPKVFTASGLWVSFYRLWAIILHTLGVQVGAAP